MRASFRTSGLHHVAVQVRDVDLVARFYKDVLGLAELTRHLRDDGTLRSIWLSSGGDGFIAIEALEADTHGPLGWSMVALRVDLSDRSAVVRSLATAQVPIERETAFTVYVKDPEGNLVGLSHYPHR